jgi:hypothetical protein
MEKSELEKLDTIQLKNICKKEGLNFDKSRQELIFALDEYFKPMRVKPTTITPNKKPKMKSVKTSDAETLREMGKLVEKNVVRRLYYANDTFVFEYL